MKDDEILHNWINGTISPEELEILKQRPEYESLVHLLKNTENLKAPDFDQGAMLKRIVAAKGSSSSQSKRKVVGFPNWARLAIAASLLALVGLFFLRDEGRVTHRLAKAEVEHGQLPDGSKYSLNAESELSYNTKTWNDDRTVQLLGEAFFEVNPGSSFKVLTDNGTIQVLGTHFNVWSRGKVLEVSCQEGKVAVVNLEGETLSQLEAGEAIRVQGNRVSKQWQNPATAKASWLNGIFQLKDVPLSRVIDELQRQFDIDIRSNNINLEELISCNFRKDNLEAALKTTMTPMGISYNIENGKTVVLTK